MKKIVNQICFIVLINSLPLNAMELTANDISNAIKADAIPLNTWLVQKVAQDLELIGVKTAIDGVVVNQSFHDANHHCTHGWFDSDIALSLSFNNSSYLIPKLTADSSVSSFSAVAILDAQASVIGGLNVHPMEFFSLTAVCFEVAPHVHRDINSPQIFSALSEFNFNLNATYISPSQSLSGKPEISFSPTGNINTRIGNYNPELRAHLQTDYSDVLSSTLSAANVFSIINKLNAVYLFVSGATLANAASSCIVGEPITCVVITAVQILVKWWSDTVDHYLSDSISHVINNVINPHVASFFNQFIGAGYNTDITNRLSTYNNIILPSESEIVSLILPKLLKVNNVCPVVAGDALKNPSKALYDFLIGDKPSVDRHLQQSKEACSAVISSINTILLSDEPCSYILTTTTQIVTQLSGSFGTSLTVGDECLWQVQTDASWVNLTSTNSGQGNGTIQYTVLANTLSNSRAGHINILDDNNQQVAQFTINQEAGADIDTDGVIDSNDNCRLTANLSQLDSDGDHFGNACDADLNNDCKTNSLDLGKFKSVYGTNTGTPALKAAADFNGDGRVNSLDLGLFKKLFGKAPGPSGLAACP